MAGSTSAGRGCRRRSGDGGCMRREWDAARRSGRRIEGQRHRRDRSRGLRRRRGKETPPAAAKLAAEDDGILSLAPPLRPPAYADLVSDPSDLLRIKPDVAAAILASRHRPEGKKLWEEDRDDDFAHGEGGSEEDEGGACWYVVIER